MKNFLKTTAIAATLFGATLAQAEVVETATFNLKDGVSYAQFTPVDKALEDNYVAKQAGFLSRETARGEKGEWLVIVRWKDAKSADSAMKSFMSAKSASVFLNHINTDTMQMKRYTVNEKTSDK